MQQRSIVTGATIPRFVKGVRLHRDWVRRRNVLLAPERVIALDQPASEILALCDGVSVDAIADTLCVRYRTDRTTVLRDVCTMLQSLFDKRYMAEGTAEEIRQHQVSTPDNPRPDNLPIAVLAELTHRCPLQCPYCSNPFALERDELTTQEWMRLIDEIAGLGVLHIHFSGGEPMARKDLSALIAHASRLGLYTNLITSGVLLTPERMDALMQAGLEHVQISFQDVDAAAGDRIANMAGAHRKKCVAAALVRDAGIPLTVNAVVHRQNLNSLSKIIDMAVEMDASRLEVAHVQYLGWALANRAALIPAEAQFREAMDIVAEAKARLQGILAIDHVIPDYYAVRPKKCMGGWGSQFLNITPAGWVLPCHAAQIIPGLSFESVRQRSLEWIWRNSPAMQKFRGLDWMKEPCRTCEFKEIDYGGCHCQAFALTGDAGATDPTCVKSARHGEVVALAMQESEADNRHFDYRNFLQRVTEDGEWSATRE